MRSLVVLLLTTAAVLLGLPGTALAAPVLPAGFTLRDMPSGQARELTDFGFAPDGSWFTTGKDGRVAWVSADGRARTLAELPVVNVDDLGLTGLAVSADYATSKRIYTARAMAAADGKRFMRLSAWTVTGSPEPTGLSAERALFELPIDSTLHAMTSLVPAADGSLWVSVGESASANYVDPLALRALDVNDGRGKILHVLPDGRGVSSNPFYDAANPSSWKSRVYASGFRSPFRMSLDPASGRPIVGDVGWYTWEEVDLVQPGKSYGWPCWEGDTRTPGYTDLPGCAGVANTAPVHTYVHGPIGTSVTGGIVYTGTSYPEAYRGAYFFGDYSSARVYTMRFDAQGQLTRQPEAAGFISDGGGPVKFAAGPNGDVVYADIYTSVLRRLVYTVGNRPPTAVATATTDPATGAVTFDGSRSSDPDGNPLTHRWDFGDGTSATGARVSHTYAGGSSYTARLTVTDSQGATGTTTVSVTPGNSPPVLTLTSPTAGRTYAVGETVQATATATDRENGALPVTWSVLLVHCSSGYCHDHPGESFTGNQFSRPFADHGDETRMEVVATATDSAGVRVQQRFVAAPRLRTLTIASTTPSPITVNGTARATAAITVGSTVSLTAPAVATNGATFSRWSDGGARTHTLTMPDRDLSLTATYLEPVGAASTNERLVRGWYSAFLGRDASVDPGHAYWVGLLDQGRSRQSVLGDLVRTREHATREVTSSYSRLLGRPLDPGAQYWVDQTADHGMAWEWVDQNVLASTEYRQRSAPAGSTASTATYVDALFQDVLGRRSGNAGELDWWSRRLAQAGPLTTVRDLWYTDEAVRHRVVGHYDRYLGRAASAGEVGYWVGPERVSDISVRVEFASSAEFVTRLR